MSSYKQVVSEPVIVDNGEEHYDTFVDQEDDLKPNGEIARSDHATVNRSSMMGGERIYRPKPRVQSEMRYEDIDDDDLPESE
ncbi:hypothetical protein N7490_007797 [Penicillium lividum]|nr:hypothetical protein N7490_007797 [Penicillium lividum]